MTRTACFAAFLFFAAPFATASDDDTLTRLSETARTAWGAPGLVAVVVNKGETRLLAGFGTRDPRRTLPFTPDTLVPLGSCTKAFTSAGVASLVADGAMSFDDPVRKHLPRFQLSDPHADALVTVRDLLSHRTGLNGHDLLWYRAPWTLAAAVEKIPRLELHGPFRGSFHYSSLTVAAAGFAAARANGTTYERLVRDRVLRPAGIAEAAFDSPQRDRFANRAAGFRRTAGGTVEPMPAYDMAEAHPAGSLHLTGRGLERWLRYQLSAATNDGPYGETKSPQTVVPRTGAVRPYHPHGTQVSYGMGWLVYDYRGRRVLAHGGMIDGFRSHVMLFPDDGVGIALVNTLHASTLNLALALTYADRLFDAPPTDWVAYFRDVEKVEGDADAASLAALAKARRADVKPSWPADRFAGTYADPAYGTGTVSADRGGLTWAWSSFRVPLEHWEGDTFRMTAEPFADRFVVFRPGPDGPTALRFAEREFRKTPAR
jgi:CubicO group peptidase (beta-lactamase class C family)